MAMREQWRTLDAEDIRHMDLPRRFWYVRKDGITANLDGNEGPLRDRIDRYVQHLEENRRNGLGLMFSGPNGVGKTAAAVCVGMEYKRRGHAVLFAPASEMLGRKIDGMWWSEDSTYWDWAKEVDVLILDDLGKGEDRGGYSQIMWDQLMRYRHDRHYVTIITTNLLVRGAESPDGIGVDTVLKPSTLEVMKECIHPLRLHGVNRRDAAAAEIQAAYGA